MAWITFTSVSVSNGGLTATVNSAEDISLLEINAGLIIGELAPVAIKKAYLGAGNSKVIELFAPWPHATQTNKAARVFNTDAGLPEATKALNDVTDLVKGDFKEVIEVSEHLSEITTVATNINYVVTTANSSAKIVTVADNISHVVNTANNMAAVIAAPTEAAKAKAEADKSAASATSALSEANRAKAEADKAKVSADAAKVSETNASNAAGDSHAPLPDVWIPFNNDLKMITGYGSDVVRIGEDTIKIAGENNATFTRASNATYIDKSGVLRAAGINEPRFEKEGLLIEGQSTNLCLFSHPAISGGSVGSLGRFYYPDSTRTLISNVTDTLPTGISGSCSNIKNVSSGYVRMMCNAGCTVSFSVKILSGKLRIAGVATGYTGARCDLEAGGVVTSIAGGAVVNATQLTGGWIRISFYDSTATSIELSVGLFTTPACEINMVDAQIEALPFATSYIPTNGAAATRAAEKLAIPKANNNCVVFYSSSTVVAPTATDTELEFAPPTRGKHLRNVKGFMAALTAAQIAALK